jgi:glycosyltransferase involved in cell wall biosynthesis
MNKKSIILPVYNTEAYLEQVIQSVLDQTLKNWELIAINDASTDKSLSILKSFERDDSRIKVIDFKKNKGLGRVRNPFEYG